MHAGYGWPYAAANATKPNQGRPTLSSAGTFVLGAVFNLNHPAHTVDWHFIHLSVANIVVIGLMVVVFVLAILLPFPGAARRRAARRNGGAS
jgi:hypothetical protein